MRIVHYPHPTLRHRSKTIQRVDKRLKLVVEEMFELMYKADGVGLAANQVDLPLQLFIVNLAARPGEGEELRYRYPPGFRRELELYSLHRALASHDFEAFGLFLVGWVIDLFMIPGYVKAWNHRVEFPVLVTESGQVPEGQWSEWG